MFISVTMDHKTTVVYTIYRCYTTIYIYIYIYIYICMFSWLMTYNLCSDSLRLVVVWTVYKNVAEAAAP